MGRHAERKGRVWDWLPPVAAASGLLVLTLFFRRELQDYSQSVIGWAERDLKARTELAASTLAEPLATSDFRSIHAFGDACAKDGVRLIVTTASGGVHFDSLRKDALAPESLYASRPCGEFIVRLGLPYDRVLAPVNRARKGLILAGCLGGFSVLIVFFFTYRQRLRIRALARLEKFRRDFIADVSHELKTPLTGILGAADLMAEEVVRLKGRDAASPALERLTGMIAGEAKRLDGLAQSILDLARLEQPDAPFVAETTDLHDLAAEVIRTVSPQARQKGVRIELAEATPRVPRVSADPRLLAQALSNLIRNAIRHSGSPVVSISLAARKARVEIAVEDHGAGIRPEERERVFERFHRVDPARAAESGGAGLGLAIVRGIARLHGGDVRLEPVNPSGCRFVIALPRS